jgi:hypothetical protein
MIAVVGWCFRGGTRGEVSHTVDVDEDIDSRVKVVPEVYLPMRDFESCVR